MFIATNMHTHTHIQKSTDILSTESPLANGNGETVTESPLAS